MKLLSNVQKNRTTDENFWNRVFIAAFVLIFLIGIGLRVHGLTTQSYYLDELYSASVSQPAHTPVDIVKACASDAHPPLYQLILWISYRSFGYTAVTGRALSAVFGILGLLTIFLLGKTLWNRKAGLFALSITSPLFFHVYYSQETRSYSLLFLMTVLCWWAAVLLLKKPTLLRAVFYAVVSLILAYTHYFGIFVLLSQAVFVMGLLVWNKKQTGKPFLYFVFAGILFILGYLPWLHPLLTNKFLSPETTWIKPVSIGFPYYFVRDYFRSGFWYVVGGTLFLIGLVWIRKEQQRQRNEAELGFDVYPYPLLWTWVLVTYFSPYLLSFIAAPMLIPRVTMVTLPAIVLLIAGLVRNFRTKNAIMISMVMVLMLTGTLIFGDHYYNHQWKEDWRSVVQTVMQADPKANSPVLAHWDYNYQAYFRLMGDTREVVRPRRNRFIQQISHLPIRDGIWVLKGHLMQDINPKVRILFEKYFKMVRERKFRMAECAYYRLKSVSAKAKLVGGKPLPTGDEQICDQFNGQFKKLPDGGIRISRDGAVESVPFIFPAGNYRIRVLARGNRVKNETARFELSVGKKTVIHSFTKEKAQWYEGELKIEHADVLPVSISFLNDYFEKIEADTPLNPGTVIKLREGDWDGTLTRKGKTRTYNARWVNNTTGKQVSDTVTVRKFTPGKIVLYRKSLNSCYRGKLSPDGTFAIGTADWYKGSGKWRATFPEFHLSKKLDRNLDILKIRVEKNP